jgi:hypothetical protein
MFSSRKNETDGQVWLLLLNCSASRSIISNDINKDKVCSLLCAEIYQPRFTVSRFAQRWFPVLHASAERVKIAMDRSGPELSIHRCLVCGFDNLSTRDEHLWYKACQILYLSKGRPTRRLIFVLSYQKQRQPNQNDLEPAPMPHQLTQAIRCEGPGN